MTSVLDAVWRRSGRCESAHCVEVADLGAAGFGLRDSVSPAQHMVVSAEAFRAFVSGVKSGEFDLR